MARLPSVLVTGFDPFGGDSINPSWEIADRLQGWKADPQHGSAVVRAVRLPCLFGKALLALDQAIDRHRPIAIIGLGLAASRRDISVERVAINIDDARIPDNAGQQPIDRSVCPDAPVAYWSTLPVKAIVSALHEAHIAASVSQSAGTFVCNHVFYGLAHRLATRGLAQGRVAATAMPIRGGFIHVPWPADYIGASDEGATTGASDEAATMDLETMITAIRIAVRVTLDAPALRPAAASGA